MRHRNQPQGQARRRQLGKLPGSPRRRRCLPSTQDPRLHRAQDILARSADRENARRHARHRPDRFHRARRQTGGDTDDPRADQRTRRALDRSFRKARRLTKGPALRPRRAQRAVRLSTQKRAVSSTRKKQAGGGAIQQAPNLIYAIVVFPPQLSFLLPTPAEKSPRSTILEDGLTRNSFFLAFSSMQIHAAHVKLGTHCGAATRQP